MRAIALYLISLWGWRRALAALAAGALMSLALPPLDLWPLIVVSFSVLVWLADGIGEAGASRASRLAQAFWIGWLFGFGYYLAGLYWIGHAFLVNAELHAWLMPFAVMLLPAGLALFTGAAVALAKALWSEGAARLLALAAAWTAFEWLRGHVLSGFPWNAVGYTLSAGEALPQLAAFVGVYGLGFLAVLAGALPALFVGESGGEARGLARRLAGPLAALALAAGLWGFGQWRLERAGAEIAEGVRLRIVQPNIPQVEKWKPGNRSRIFARLMELSNKATSPDSMGVSDVTHLIWPESAVPFLLSEQGDALAAIAALLPDNGVLFSGSLRRDSTRQASSGRRPRIYNSILQIDGSGRVSAIYDKFHLVPFGEYLPGEAWLSRLGIRKLVAAPAGFGRGAGPLTMTVPGAPPASPLICYEVIFPGAVADRQARPGWLLNLTNDAWFGDSIGPYQHLRQARLRAIEEGLPLVRAANTGISAVIDAHGRILRRLPLNAAGVIDSNLPAPIAPTVYVRYGDRPLLVLLIVCAGLAAAVRRRGAGARRQLSADTGR